jgi:hypothetical protein
MEEIIKDLLDSWQKHRDSLIPAVLIDIYERVFE